MIDTRSFKLSVLPLPNFTWSGGVDSGTNFFGTYHAPSRTMWIGDTGGGNISVISTVTNALVVGIDISSLLFNVWLIYDRKNEQMVAFDQRGAVAFIDPVSYGVTGHINYLDSISPGTPPHHGVCYSSTDGLAILVTPSAPGLLGVLNCNSRNFTYRDTVGTIGRNYQHPTFNQSVGKVLIGNADTTPGASPYYCFSPITFVYTPSSLSIGGAKAVYYVTETQKILLTTHALDFYVIDAVTDTVEAGPLSIVNQIESVVYVPLRQKYYLTGGSGDIYRVDPNSSYASTLLSSDAVLQLWYDSNVPTIIYGLIENSRHVKGYVI